jgi:hypothetical protein
VSLRKQVVKWIKMAPEYVAVISYYEVGNATSVSMKGE